MPVEIVIETLPGRALAVAQRLMSVPGLMLRDGPANDRLEGTWAVEEGWPLDRLPAELALDPDVRDVRSRPLVAGR